MTKFRATMGALVIIALLSGCGADPSTDESTALPPSASPPVSATVEWDIPQTRVNGDNLTLGEIGGYEILYRNTNQRSYTSVTIDDQTADRYIIRNLTPGEYEVLVAAFDVNGLYSDFSAPLVASIGI